MSQEGNGLPPRANRGVPSTGQIPSEESELLRIEFSILLLSVLHRDIPLDLAFAPMMHDRADEVSAQSDIATPEVLLDHGDRANLLAGSMDTLWLP